MQRSVFLTSLRLNCPSCKRRTIVADEIPKFSDKEVAQALAVVLMCATQHGLVNHLFPKDGASPKLDKFTDVGVKGELLQKFIQNANQTHAAPVFRDYCEGLAALHSTITQNYSPPYCP